MYGLDFRCYGDKDSFSIPINQKSVFFIIAVKKKTLDRFYDIHLYQ